MWYDKEVFPPMKTIILVSPTRFTYRGMANGWFYFPVLQNGITSADTADEDKIGAEKCINLLVIGRFLLVLGDKLQKK